ncbi:MAG TPA: cyclomaltodextrinase C-terminal domain-containing protein, partial [Phnomibacter sp.]|nr:cyclomaltodextrinase C-terminal domain-containing protein [Phnomibacter sp.]
IPRFWSVVNEDIRKMKVGMAWLLTCRGIPQMYYGMEVLMPGLTSPNDGHVRKDFPGGWPGDTKNAFTGQGLTTQEKEFLEYTRGLAMFRKNSSAIKTGKMTQFVPQDGVYVYFRHDDEQTVMVVMNTQNEEKTLDLERFNEITHRFLIAKDATSTGSLDLKGLWQVPAMTCWVLELK